MVQYSPSSQPIPTLRGDHWVVERSGSQIAHGRPCGTVPAATHAPSMAQLATSLRQLSLFSSHELEQALPPPQSRCAPPHAPSPLQTSPVVQKSPSSHGTPADRKLQASVAWVGSQKRQVLVPSLVPAGTQASSIRQPPPVSSETQRSCS
jgi:hypothetical protein